MASPSLPRGIFTAIVTPFDPTGAIDFKSLDRLLDLQIAAKVSGIVPCGTTGESPTLTKEEKKSVITHTLKKLKGTGVLTYAGTGSNDTRETIELSKWASDQGVDGLLVVTPYYNKPSQSGLAAHFTAVADAVSCPVMVYNVPGRTAVSISADTLADLAAHARIRSCKEATGNLAFASEIVHTLAKKKRAMQLLSGDDATFLPFLSVGGQGCVSVASNLFPKKMVALFEAAVSGNLEKGQALNNQLFLSFRDLFVEANPVPVKFALEKMGLCSSKVRLPLSTLTQASQEKVKAAIEGLSHD